MKVETEDLISVVNFAKEYKKKDGTPVTTQYIYRLITKRKLNPITIDGHRFLLRKDLKKAGK